LGFYFRASKNVRLGVTRRGVRGSFGPRAFRFHAGRGGTGISSGTGPVSIYKPLPGRGKARTSGSPSSSTLSSTASLSAKRASASPPTPSVVVVAFLLSLGGLCFLSAIAGIALGSLGYPKTQPSSIGRGFALAAILIGSGWLCLELVLFIMSHQ